MKTTKDMTKSLTATIRRFSCFKNDQDAIYKDSLVNNIAALNLKHGVAVGDGDCFYDACAEAYSFLKQPQKINYFELRKLVQKYISLLHNENKDNWIRHACVTEKNGKHVPDVNKYEKKLIGSGMSAIEIKIKNNDNFINSEFGDIEIEGKIICQLLKINIHVIEIRNNPANLKEVLLTDQLMTAQGGKNFEQSKLDLNNTIHIAVFNNHFIPLITKNAQQEEQFVVKIESVQQTVSPPIDNFNCTSHTWYTDEDITTLLSLKIKQIGGYVKDNIFLLAGIGDGKFPDEDTNRYFTLVMPAIDTQSKALPIDYFIDKSKQPRNSLALFLEKILPHLAELLPHQAGENIPEFKVKLERILSNDISANDREDTLNKMLTALNELNFNQKAIIQKIQQLDQNTSRDVFDEIKAIIKEPGELYIKILFPYNKTQLHWLTGEIKIHRNNKHYLIELTAHDPYGNGQILPKNLNILRNVLKQKIEALDSNAIINFKPFESGYPPRQHAEDSNSCGVIVVEDLFKRIAGASLIQQNPYTCGANELRQDHVLLVEQNLLAIDKMRIGFLNRRKLGEGNKQHLPVDKKVSSHIVDDSTHQTLTQFAEHSLKIQAPQPNVNQSASQNDVGGNQNFDNLFNNGSLFYRQAKLKKNQDPMQAYLFYGRAKDDLIRAKLLTTIPGEQEIIEKRLGKIKKAKEEHKFEKLKI